MIGIDFLICVKASTGFGMGHLSRAIQLYRLLEKSKYVCLIVLVESDSRAECWVNEIEVNYHLVPSGAHTLDWELEVLQNFRPKVWINDFLETELNSAVKIKSEGALLVVVDDQGKGASIADIHIAPLLKLRSRRTIGGKRVFSGVDYFIMPQEARYLRRARISGSNALITLGGSDSYKITQMLFDWAVTYDSAVRVVLGPGVEPINYDCVEGYDHVTVLETVPSLMVELANADFAITGGGLSAFEAAALGVPTAIIANEPWEVNHARYLEDAGCSIYLGYREAFDLRGLKKMSSISTMSQAALNTIGINGCERVSRLLMSLIK